MLWAAPAVVVFGGLTALVLWGLSQIPEESPYPGSCAGWSASEHVRLNSVPLGELVGEPSFTAPEATCEGDSTYILSRTVKVGHNVDVPTLGTSAGAWTVVRVGDPAGSWACLTSDRNGWSGIGLYIGADGTATAAMYQRHDPDPCGVEATLPTIAT